MKGWRRDLQYAAVGIVTAAIIEVLTGAGEGAGARRAEVGRVLLAGAIAAAYAHVVPAESWGARSGAAFAQLPMVVSAHASLGEAPPLRLGIWGALTGLALRLLPLEH